MSRELREGRELLQREAVDLAGAVSVETTERR